MLVTSTMTSTTACMARTSARGRNIGRSANRLGVADSSSVANAGSPRLWSNIVFSWLRSNVMQEHTAFRSLSAEGAADMPFLILIEAGAL